MAVTLHPGNPKTPTLQNVANCIAQQGIKSLCPQQNYDEMLCIILCCCDQHNDIRTTTKAGVVRNQKQMCMNSMQIANGLRSNNVFQEVAFDIRARTSVADYTLIPNWRGNWLQTFIKMRRVYGGKIPKDTLIFVDSVWVPPGHSGPITPDSGAKLREIKFNDVVKRDANREQVEKMQKIDTEAKQLDREKCDCKDLDGSTETEESRAMAADGVQALKDLLSYSKFEAVMDELNPIPIQMPHIPYTDIELAEELGLPNGYDMMDVFNQFKEADLYTGVDPMFTGAARAALDIYRLRKKPFSIFGKGGLRLPPGSTPSPAPGH